MSATPNDHTAGSEPTHHDPGRESVIEELEALFRDIMRPPRGGPPPLVPAHQDLTMGQFRALMVLARAEPLGLGALAEKLAVGLPAASRMVDRLVQDGLVERWEDPDDRRRVLVRLAERGRESMEEMHQGRATFRGAMRERVRRLVSKLDDAEMALLRGGLLPLAEHARSEQSDLAQWPNRNGE